MPRDEPRRFITASGCLNAGLAVLTLGVVLVVAEALVTYGGEEQEAFPSWLRGTGLPVLGIGAVLTFVGLLAVRNAGRPEGASESVRPPRLLPPRQKQPVTPAELRRRAVEEAADLGPEPADPHEHSLWVEERRGAVVLLAAFADWDASLCRQAAVEAEWDPVVQRLLLDAVQECR